MDTRSLSFGPNKPNMLIGPYLVFVRSRLSFSDHHDFQDWPFLATSLTGKLWGADSLIAYVANLKGFSDMGDLPEWVDFIEVASISPDIAAASYSEDEAEKEGWYSPCMANLIEGANAGTVPEKPCFDNRLVLVSLFDDADERQSMRLLDRLKSFLGPTATGVWHSRELVGIAFKDGRSPSQLGPILERILKEDDVHDFGVFKIADVATEIGVPSPLASFLTPH